MKSAGVQVMLKCDNDIMLPNSLKLYSMIMIREANVIPMPREGTRDKDRKKLSLCSVFDNQEWQEPSSPWICLWNRKASCLPIVRTSKRGQARWQQSNENRVNLDTLMPGRKRTSSSRPESYEPATQYVFPKLFRSIMLVSRLCRLLSMHCADRMWYSFDAKTLLAWG